MTRSWNAPLFFGEFGANNDPNPDIQDFQVRPTKAIANLPDQGTCYQPASCACHDPHQDPQGAGAPGTSRCT